VSEKRGKRRSKRLESKRQDDKRWSKTLESRRRNKEQEARCKSKWEARSEAARS